MPTKEEARLRADSRAEKARLKAASEHAAMEGYRAAAAAIAARTARLREERLAREAAERAAPPPPSVRRRVRKPVAG